MYSGDICDVSEVSIRGICTLNLHRLGVQMERMGSPQ